jgi:hypothetical protein
MLELLGIGVVRPNGCNLIEIPTPGANACTKKLPETNAIIHEITLQAVHLRIMSQSGAVHAIGHNAFFRPRSFITLGTAP